MRITGGDARGRLLRAPRSRGVRPTADKVRAAIFNILEARYEIAGHRVLDLFAGSGALGLDALSRGARSAVFVDHSGPSCETIRRNLEQSGLAERAEVRRGTLPQALSRIEAEERFGGVFLDPPYRLGLGERTLERLGTGSCLLPDAWVVAEHAADEDFLDAYGELERRASKRYGSTAVSLYVRRGRE